MASAAEFQTVASYAQGAEAAGMSVSNLSTQPWDFPQNQARCPRGVGMTPVATDCERLERLHLASIAGG
jgi:hypothetical protein